LGIFLLGWTTALLMPNPQYWAEPLVPHQAFYPSAKTLHVCSYAVLAILAGWVKAPVRARWFLLLFLSAHAFGTEGLQLFVPGRTGTITDVGFDHLGLYLGLLASWRWWR
jgi:VanZ family protein